jgi:hypothetical protein
MRAEGQMGRKAIIGIVAFGLLIASLGGAWLVISENVEMRLTGEMLSNYVRSHPPKPWRGFDIKILNVSVDRQVHIKAHVSGNLIHTPVEISGAPEYDANARAIFLHVSRAGVPRDEARPMLSRFNSMLSPLATYIARNVAEIIPAKRIRSETPGGAMFLTTVRSVRVNGDVVVVALHGYRIAAAAIVLMLCALLSAFLLSAMVLRIVSGLKK